VDEYHEHDTSDLYDTMATGMAARLQPLLLVISTAGSNLAGPCRDDWLACEAMLTAGASTAAGGEVMASPVDETKFALIFCADQDDDWTDEKSWAKANPNLGVSVPVAFIRQQVTNAIAQPRLQGSVKTKHLNLWVTAMHGYFDVQAFTSAPVADGRVNLGNEYAGRACFEGVDGAAKRDIAARVKIFPRPDVEGFDIFGTYYLPRATVDLPQNQHYRAWEAAGWLTVCDGNVNDFEKMHDDVVADSKLFNLQAVGFDPWQLQSIAQRWGAAGLPVVEIPQHVRFFSETMKQLDALIAAGKIRHGADPVMAWAISNVVAKADARGNVYPRKERESAKIDPVMALLMALSRAQAAPAPSAAGFAFI
jgi:phage terminase large subunit-like protein